MWVERGKTELIIALIALTLMGCSHAHVHKKAAGTFTVHVYPEGPCHLCHIGKGTYIGSENLRAPGKKLCFMCHSFRKEKYVHRAIELWDCAICHNPHGTDNPFLLKSPLPALCFGCHVESDIRSMEVHKDLRLPGLLRKAGQALAVVHKELVLPEEMKHELPTEWMASAGENVFIHGDFACVNVCFHEPSDELVILDWSAAPLVGRIPTFGSRYFDILLFVSSIFHGAPWRRALSWNAKEMADIFLKGYAEIKQDGFKSYSSQICQLQRRNIRQLAAQKQLFKAAGFLSHQMLMNIRLRLFLNRYK